MSKLIQQPKWLPDTKYFLLSLLLAEEDYRVIYQEAQNMGLPAHVLVHLLVSGYVYLLRHGQFDREKWLRKLAADSYLGEAKGIDSYISSLTILQQFRYPDLTRSKLAGGRIAASINKTVLAQPHRVTSIHVARILKAWYHTFINAFDAQHQLVIWQTWVSLWYQDDLPPINAVLQTLALDWEATGGNLPPAHKWLQTRPWHKYQDKLKNCIYHRDRPGTMEFFGAWYCQQCVEAIGLRPVPYIYVDKSKRAKKKQKKETANARTATVKKSK